LESNAHDILLCVTQNGEERNEDVALAASAEEARRRLQKKSDVKNANMSLREKHELIETL